MLFCQLRADSAALRLKYAEEEAFPHIQLARVRAHYSHTKTSFAALSAQRLFISLDYTPDSTAGPIVAEIIQNAVSACVAERDTHRACMEIQLKLESIMEVELDDTCLAKLHTEINFLLDQAKLCEAQTQELKDRAIRIIKTNVKLASAVPFLRDALHRARREVQETCGQFSDKLRFFNW